MRSKRLLFATVVGLLALSACGGSDDPGAAVPGAASPEPEVTEPTTEPTSTEPASTEPASTEPASTEPASTEPASTVPTPPDPTTTAPAPDVPDVGRVVVLAEEWMLADVLALGIPVVASSATVPSAGFQGMDGFDTTGIEIFDYLDVSLEELAALRADHIIVGEFVVDRLGEDQVAGIEGELIVLPDGSTGPERLRLVGEAFGLVDRAEALLAELDDTYAEAEAKIPADCDVTVVAVYTGPNVAVFAEPVWDVPRAVDRLGCRLVPGPGDVETDANGRAYLSLEQLGLLDGSTMLMLQTDTVEGERDAIADVESGPLWGQLPAVAGGSVVELDRLGYPGVVGEMRLVDDLVAVMGEAP